MRRIVMCLPLIHRHITQHSELSHYLLFILESLFEWLIVFTHCDWKLHYPLISSRDRHYYTLHQLITSLVEISPGLILPLPTNHSILIATLLITITDSVLPSLHPCILKQESSLRCKNKVIFHTHTHFKLAHWKCALTAAYILKNSLVAWLN